MTIQKKTPLKVGYSKKFQPGYLSCPKGPFLAEYYFHRLFGTLLILLGFKFQLIIVEDESKNYLQLSAAFL